MCLLVDAAVGGGQQVDGDFVVCLLADVAVGGGQTVDTDFVVGLWAGVALKDKIGVTER